MTIGQLLEHLDGQGLVLTDEDLLIEALSEIGHAMFDEIKEY